MHNSAKDQGQLIDRLVKKIAAEFDPEKIILFGSYAWGEPRFANDVDLFIIKDTSQQRLERGKAVERIIMGAGIPVDALIYTPNELQKRLMLDDAFIKRVISRGKVMYERKTNTKQ